uniref:Uncharacterized protein n=1 Tax=Periophthalmus magnuspinnatus TaxID=409849 RepID=A0A3B3ZKK6_9GOBI
MAGKLGEERLKEMEAEMALFEQEVLGGPVPGGPSVMEAVPMALAVPMVRPIIGTNTYQQVSPLLLLCAMGVSLGSGWVQAGFRLGSGWVQAGFRLGSGWVQAGFRLGSGWVQAGFRLGSGWVQAGFRLPRPPPPPPMMVPPPLQSQAQVSQPIQHMSVTTGVTSAPSTTLRICVSSLSLSEPCLVVQVESVSEDKRKSKGDKLKKCIRTAAGTSWEDASLLEWDSGKYVGSRPIKLRKSMWKDRNIEVVRKKQKEKKKLGLR